MLNAVADICHWQFNAVQLSDSDLVDKLVLSMCDSYSISYPHFKLQLLVSELVSNAIDHGVLSLSSRQKGRSATGYERYLIERSRRLEGLSCGSVSLSAEWVGNNLLRISVEDSGAGFDFAIFNNNSDFSDNDRLPKLYGRGLAIINSLCNSVLLVGNGNCIVVEFDVATV